MDIKSNTPVSMILSVLAIALACAGLYLDASAHTGWLPGRILAGFGMAILAVALTAMKRQTYGLSPETDRFRKKYQSLTLLGRFASFGWLVLFVAGFVCLQIPGLAPYHDDILYLIIALFPLLCVVMLVIGGAKSRLLKTWAETDRQKVRVL